MRSSKSEIELPTQFFAGKLEGLTRKDAELYVRGIIPRLCHSTENVAFGLFKIDGSYLYEIHEGGERKALMPSIWKMLNEGETDHVVVHTAVRNVEIFIEDGRLMAAMLPESDKMAPNEIEAGKKLKAFENDYSGFLISSVAIFCASSVLLASALVINAIIADIKVSAIHGAGTPPAALPIMQLPISVGENEYVHALRYDGQRWNLQKRNDMQPSAPRTPPGAEN